METRNKSPKALFAKSNATGFQHVPASETPSVHVPKASKPRRFKVPKTSGFRKLK